MEDKNFISLKIAECAVAGHNTVISTAGIGSCLVVCLYDGEAGIGGMAHCMLPTRKFPKSEDDFSAEEKKGKYIDEAIDYLVEEIERQGGHRQNLRAKLVGGAEMFSLFKDGHLSLGRENLEAAKNKLAELGIKIASEDTGGAIGRTASLNLDNGILSVSIKM